MLQVTEIRTVPVPVSDVRTQLTPTAIVTYESGYEPKGTSTLNGKTVVLAEPAGRLFEPRYVFEPEGDSYRYRRDDEQSFAVDIQTTIELASRNGSTEIRFRSTITPRIPVPLLGRIIAWRRRRVLSRVCNRLSDALGQTE